MESPQTNAELVEIKAAVIDVKNGAAPSEDPSNFPVYLTRQNSRKSTHSSQTSGRRINKKPPRLVRRLINKNGTSNVIRSKIKILRDRFIRDLANTLVNSRWRWTVISLSSSFVLSWVIFAAIWMIISNANGDFDSEHPSKTPCLSGIEGFGGYVMFSMETQQTIGYGSRYINHYCPEATFLMCLQIILGCAICGAMVSIVNAKMVRPFELSSRNLFSKKAVIGIRDGKLCLIFRIRDENQRYSIGTTINAYLVQSRPGEPFLKSLHLEPCGILIWPLEVIHKITPSSPFWDLSAKELIAKRFEIIATMVGTSAITGQCSKTRTSYLSTEILWGCRFKPCVSFNHSVGSYVVDHTKFHETEQVTTPLCSAQRLGEVIEELSTPFSYPNSPVFTFDSPFPDIIESSDGESEYDNLDEKVVRMRNGRRVRHADLNGEVKRGEDRGERNARSARSALSVDLEALLETIKTIGIDDCKETDV